MRDSITFKFCSKCNTKSSEIPIIHFVYRCMNSIYHASLPMSQGSGLISSYETNPLCPAGELDLDPLRDLEVLLRRLGVASGDLEWDSPRLLDLDLGLPLSGECWSPIRGPRRDFNLSLTGGRSAGLRLRLGLRSLYRPRYPPGLREMLLLRLLCLRYLYNRHPWVTLCQKHNNRIYKKIKK